MSENFVMSGNLVELAEFKTYKLGTFLISVLDEWDLNHRFITTEEGRKSCESIIGFPIVAKLVTDGDGNPVDFRGHEVYQEKMSNGETVYRYGTTPIGSVVNAWVEKRNVAGYSGEKNCIMIQAKIWSVRCPEYCMVLDKLWAANKVHTSWELIAENSEIVREGKILKDISFIGNCLLGTNVPGAVPGAGMVQCAAQENIDTDEFELAAALARDSIKSINKIEEKEIAELDTEKIIDSVPEIENAQETDPETTPSPESSTSSKSIEANDNTPNEGECKKKKCAEEEDESECKKKKCAEEEDESECKKKKEAEENAEKIASLTSQLEKANALVSELTDKLKDTVAEVAELKIYKEKYSEVERQRVEAEKAEKRSQIVGRAVKSGFIAEAEFESDETLKTCLANMDEAGVKSIIADRLLASLDKHDETPKAEVAESSPAAAANISDGEDVSATDFRSVMDSYFGK